MAAALNRLTREPRGGRQARQVKAVREEGTPPPFLSGSLAICSPLHPLHLLRCVVLDAELLRLFTGPLGHSVDPEHPPRHDGKEARGPRVVERRNAARGLHVEHLLVGLQGRVPHDPTPLEAHDDKRGRQPAGEQ